ncbi:MAG: hypothetical protein PVF24_09930, partial [Desulfobacterales bacterium]
MRSFRACLQLNNAIFLALAILMALALSACSEKNEYVEPPAPEVTVSKPLVKDVTEYLEFTGTTRPIEEIEIRARVEGF